MLCTERRAIVFASSHGRQEHVRVNMPAPYAWGLGHQQMEKGGISWKIVFSLHLRKTWPKRSDIRRRPIDTQSTRQLRAYCCELPTKQWVCLSMCLYMCGHLRCRSVFCTGCDLLDFSQFFGHKLVNQHPNPHWKFATAIWNLSEQHWTLCNQGPQGQTSVPRLVHFLSKVNEYERTWKNVLIMFTGLQHVQSGGFLELSEYFALFSSCTMSYNQISCR